MYKDLKATTLILILSCSYAIAADRPSFVDVTLSQTNYSGRPQLTEQNQQYSSVIPSFEYFRRSGSPENAHHVFWGTGVAVLPMSDGVDLGIAVPELHYQFVPVPNRFALTLGRKKHTWSELDNYWNLGLWQPLVRWDAAEPIEQGLLGLFFQMGNNKVRSTLLVSGLFLPDQQPDFEEQKGQIISANRWFRAPVASIDIESSPSRVLYRIEEPSVENVVFRGTLAAQVEIGDPAIGFYAQFSATDKPQNQLHIAVDPSKGFSVSSSTLNVPVYPTVVRHQLYTAESGYRWSDSKIVVSANIEEIKDPRLPDEWEETELIDSRYTGVIYTHDLKRLGFKRSQLGLSYVARNKQSDTNSATVIEGDIEASTSRFAFEEMAGLHFKTSIMRTYKRELDVAIKYVHSISDRGEWLQAGMHLRENRNWIWSLSTDIFGVPSQTATSTSFISTFRGNDRVSGSLTYVF